MALHGDLKALSLEILDEYLAAAKQSIDTSKPGGGCLGYPAALLLLCVTDAIGHSLNVGHGAIRLNVLTHPIFGLSLNNSRINNLRKWYRNPLTHNALMAAGVFLTAETGGAPFDFDHNGSLTVIRVPVFYDLVKSAWDKHRSGFNSPAPKRAPSPTATVPSSTNESSGATKR